MLSVDKVNKPNSATVALLACLIMIAGVASLVEANFFPQDFKVIIDSPTNGTKLTTTNVTLNVKTTVETDFYASDKTLSYSLDGSADIAFTNLERNISAGLNGLMVHSASAEITDLTSGPHTIVVHAQNRYASTEDNPYGFTLSAESACSFEVDALDARSPTPQPLFVVPSFLGPVFVVILVFGLVVGCLLVFLRRRGLF
jgi:hypothetical protein